MQTYPEVLVGTDGSPAAGPAVAAGSRLAAALDAPLILVTVWDGIAGAESPWAESVTTAAAEVARDLGVATIRHRHPTGRPADVLVEVSGQHPQALLVIGARGLSRTADRLLGNVASHVAHNCAGDVLLCRAVEVGDGWSTVALATDGSTTATQAARVGLEVAAAVGATPTLVTAAQDQDEGDRALSSIVADLGIDGQAPATQVRIGQPGRALVEASGDYDLMVMGNRRMSGPSRLLGSVANKVTNDGTCDLLLVNTSK